MEVRLKQIYRIMCHFSFVVFFFPHGLMAAGAQSVICTVLRLTNLCTPTSARRMHLRIGLKGDGVETIRSILEVLPKPYSFTVKQCKNKPMVL